jgi:hypothetical protein
MGVPLLYVHRMDGRGSGSGSAAPCAWLGLLCVVVVAIHGAIAAAGGVVGIPRNDDWVFLRDLEASLELGQVVLDPWTQTMLVGHLAWAAPVAALVEDPVGPLQMLVALMGAVALWVMALVVRTFASLAAAVVAVVVVGLGPLFGGLAVSYMSDVPAFLLQMLTLLLGTRALLAPTFAHATWMAALACGFWGFTIREFSVAALLALGVGLSRGALGLSRRERAVGATSLGSALAACGAAYLWRQGIVASPSTASLWTGMEGPVDVSTDLFRQLMTVALLVSPALAVWVASVARSAGADGRSRQAAAVLLAVIVVSASAVAVLFHRGLGNVVAPIGNYVVATPSYAPTLVGNATAVIPSSVFWPIRGLGVLALIAWVVVVSAVAKRSVRTRLTEPATLHDVPIAVARSYVAIAVGLPIMVGLLSGSAGFDRYFLPALGLLVGLLLAEVERTWSGWARDLAVPLVLAGGCWAAWGLVTAEAAVANDSLRWSAGEELVARGYPAAEIEGGYEWFGYHQLGLPDLEGQQLAGTGFWTSLFRESRVCVKVSYPDAATTGDVVFQATESTMLGSSITVVATRSSATCGP